MLTAIYSNKVNLKILHRDQMQFVSFVWMSEQTGSCTLYFITEVERVYCEVRACLYIPQIHLVFKKVKFLSGFALLSFGIML